MISCPLGRLATLQLVEREVRHDALAGLAVDNHLVSAAHHAFHRLEEDALARHLRRLLVFVEHLEEARRLALRLGDRLLLEAFGGLQDALGFTARFRHHLVGVGERFVLQALLVGARGLNVAEGVDDLARRVDLLQRHLIDLDAGLIAVERLLDQCQHGGFRLLPCLREDRLNVGLTDNLAHGAFRHFLHGVVGVRDVEQILFCVLDAPVDDEVDVDRVLVAGQHQALFFDVLRRPRRRNRDRWRPSACRLR